MSLRNLLLKPSRLYTYRGSHQKPVEIILTRGVREREEGPRRRAEQAVAGLAEVHQRAGADLQRRA